MPRGRRFRRRAGNSAALGARYDRLVRTPLITLSCDCGAQGAQGLVALGERWTCPTCGRTYDTSQIPKSDLDELLGAVKRYRLLALGPPVVAAAVLVPLAIYSGLQYAFLLFILMAAWGLMVLPHLRRRAERAVRESVPRWNLRPE